MTKKTKGVSVPSQISLLVEAINCDNQDAARLLVNRAMLMIYGPSVYDPSAKDIDAVIALIRGINPKDTVESILAAQYVALHLKAMSIIEEDNYNIIGQGMMMIRLSHQALNTLQQYRGKSQTINVNYNVHSEGNAVLNTLVQTGGTLKNGE